uniref:VWFA domain-containing protein n=1 Tax=Steinernema glaseri TaxID=37863 RepID=A0A1I7ZRS8_9BILA
MHGASPKVTAMRIDYKSLPFWAPPTRLGLFSRIGKMRRAATSLLFLYFCVVLCDVGNEMDEVETLLGREDLAGERRGVDPREAVACERTGFDVVFVLDAVWENDNYNAEVDAIEKFVAKFEMGAGPGQTRFGSRMRNHKIDLHSSTTQAAFVSELREQRKTAVVQNDLAEYAYNQGDLLTVVIDEDFPASSDRSSSNVTKVAVVFMIASLQKGSEPYGPYARYAAEKDVQVFVVPVGPWPTLKEALALAGNRPERVIGAASTRDFAITPVMDVLFHRIMSLDACNRQ